MVPREILTQSTRQKWEPSQMCRSRAESTCGETSRRSGPARSNSLYSWKQEARPESDQVPCLRHSQFSRLDISLLPSVIALTGCAMHDMEVLRWLPRGNNRIDPAIAHLTVAQMSEKGLSWCNEEEKG